MQTVDILVGFVLVLVTAAAAAAHERAHHLLSFHFHECLQHLEVDVASQSVYVGAKNRIFHLDGDLRLVQEVRTGPVLDNVHCTEVFGENPCSSGGTAWYEATPTDNVNKVLVVDPVNGQLITCGCVHQGICQTRSLVNISITRQHYNRGNTDYFIAANHPEYSTIAFIGPGPGSNDVLYIATTYTGMVSTSVRQTVPAVSSRSLIGPSAFRFASMDGLTGGTFVRLRREAIEKYLISYVAGFSVNGFSYFLTTQPETFSLENSGFLPTVSSKVVSKIVQVCQSDLTYHSYVEMLLRCATNGNEYNQITAAALLRPGFDLAKKLQIRETDHILLAAFTKRFKDRDRVDEDDIGRHDQTKSAALCLFRFTDVRHKFTQNVQKCFSGHQKFAGSQFSNRMCVSLEMSLNSSYCGEAEQNGPLVGTVSLESVPIREFHGVELTAVAGSVTGHHTVLFLGTSDGHLKKILLEGDGNSWEYEDVIIQQGSPINPDIKFDFNQTHLYAMTKTRVFKVAVSNCEHHSTCEECRAARDPYCGWCSLQRKCSNASSCLLSSHFDRWLSHRSWECIRIPSQFVDPIQIGVKKSIQVKVGVKALPLLQEGEEYLCVFGSNLSISVGLTSPNEIRCQTPRLESISGIQSNADHANITLFIRSTQTGINFLETVLMFYDCEQHKSCTLCSRSSWDCYWCISSNTCLQGDDISTCSDAVIEVPEMCPRLMYVASGQILIPSGALHQVSLAASFLPHTMVSDSSYECLIHLTSPPIRIPARRLSSSALVCDSYEYTYEAEEPTKTVSLEVMWNGDRYIDDTFGMTITIYRCDVMASDCSSCLGLQESFNSVQYGCQWCSDRCQSNWTCGSLYSSAVCPLPDIQEVYPLSGPLEGGTRLTIKGINLGRSYEQVRHAVKVAGIPCETVPSEYIISRLIVCRVGRVASFRRGSVVVTVGDATVSWETEFTFQNPQVTRIFPVVGPKAGGTKVTFEGHNLDTGAAVQVFFLNAKPCHVEYLNSSHIECTTESTAQIGFCPISIKFDDSVRNLPMKFEFVENPSITDIRPLSTFRSGGRLITVTGVNLDSVQHPVMHLHKRSNKYSSKCFSKTGSVLLCATPFLSSSSSDGKVSRSTTPADYGVSFTMDNVESVRHLSIHYPLIKSVITVYPDPVYNRFENGVRLYKGEALILTGQSLNLACEVDEVKVWIGNETCKVNSVDLKTLYCSPPPDQPSHLRSDGSFDPNSLPLVKVVVGNLVYTLGQLEYQRMAPDDSEYWIIGVAFGGGTLLMVIFVILIVYKRKSTKAERQFKKLNMQLDALEINIRNECKQAFAELQTEVSDFTSDLNVIGIPFWDYTSYANRILFPTDNVCLSSLIIADDPHLTELLGFKDLFYNQHFVTIFVRTLEQQKNFTVRDKAKVASLLTVVFHDRLDYATQILKVLLSDLIDRSVERKHPKLMLRRTESVVEKLLTNWLSMCLHGYVKTRAGKALFMLYKAIKHQTEKGPIDAITSDARYSLSEDRLLREKTEAKALTVYLVSSHENMDPICCRMLDCDIITQAKEKALDAVYMNMPFSRRPSVDHVDLEWLSSPSGRLVLRDEDCNTEVIRGWKRLNTLAQYRVPDGATMALIARQNKLNPNSHSSDVSKLSINISNTVSASDERARHFHLVLPEEGQHIGRSQKVVSEIFLTRLLATKCTLQKYVDDLFCVILTPDTSCSLYAVKYLFDFLDSAAQRHGITDTEVLHTWKCNSLLLRFWVNIIKNPEFVFDIHKSPIVDSCLSIIAQTFMDSCSTQDQRLGKDSPSTKLLYAKDIPRYRHLVTQFYKSISDMSPVDNSRMDQLMTEHSKVNSAHFSEDFALQELYKFVKQYNLELMEALEDDSIAQKEQMSKTFKQVSASLENVYIA